MARDPTGSASGGSGSDSRRNARSGPLRPLTDIGSRAAAATMRPLSGAVEAAVEAGIGLERRAVDRLLDSDELERIVMTVLDSEHVQATLRRALESDGAKRLIDTFFDSGLFDRLAERLLESDALWRLVDEIAQSPSVLAAVSHQGLGFADQVGGEMRARSRRADDRLERLARRLARRDSDAPAPEDAEQT